MRNIRHAIPHLAAFLYERQNVHGGTSWTDMDPATDRDHALIIAAFTAHAKKLMKLQRSVMFDMHEINELMRP